jgi:hypothetical protein
MISLYARKLTVFSSPFSDIFSTHKADGRCQRPVFLS